MRMTKAEFIGYLLGTLIPDLRDSGRIATAVDFEAAVLLLNGASAVEVDTTTGTVCIAELATSPDYAKIQQYMNAHDMSKWGFELDGPASTEDVEDLLDSMQLPPDANPEEDVLPVLRAQGFPKLKRSW